MAVTVNIINQAGKSAGELEISDSVLGVEPKPAVIRQALDTYLKNQRQGNHYTKGRSDVIASNSKPFKQKGTGRARAGTRRSPIWRGGGIVFGPRPRKYTQALNRKMRGQALTGVLSDYQREGSLFAVESIDLDSPKTKLMVEFLDSIKVGAYKTLILVDPGKKDEKGNYSDSTKNLFLSARNLPGVTALAINNINIYDLLRHDKLVITKDALNRLQEIYDEK